MSPWRWRVAALQSPRGRQTLQRTALSFGLHVVAFLPLALPFAIAVTTWFLMVFTKLFFVSGFHWWFHHTPSSAVQAWLRRVVTPRNRGAYVAAGGQSTLTGNLLLMFLFFWPVPVIAYQALRQASPWLWALWMASIVRDLCTGAVVMDYERPVRENFGYNLAWMWELIFAVIVGIPTMIVMLVVFAIGATYGWSADDLHRGMDWTAFLIFVGGMHLAQFTMRMDTANVDWSGQGEPAAKA